MITRICPFDQLTPLEVYQLLQLREEVFVLEQTCLYKDMDDIDLVSTHILDYEGDKLTSCARVFVRDAESSTVQIGRMVTSPLFRRQRRGLEVMRQAVEVARQQYHARLIYIEAQVYAIPFYRLLGFEVSSDEFLEDGIPHVQMIIRVA